ncbi:MULTISPECIES: hypothetical protein [unclassified Microbacterium]|uniref:hypothetical protein n=1 Tax=unclassified Microbacterium TaxID=2609290 RepID=UPI0012F92384|nr:hypothetical protein [Microbacterium sp. MAH-37]MVQ43345.1 hypothetical protein [Microbacterium sp. MAH-37]
MSEAHRQRAVEWFLVLRQMPLDEALTLALAPPPQVQPDHPEPTEDLDSPPLYDTGLDVGEGLWLRTGWAGRG